MYASFERFEIDLPKDVVYACSHPGPCDDDVAEALQRFDVASELAKLDPENLRAELAEYGAWECDELADHEQNLARILWIAAGNIRQELDQR